MCLGGGGDSCAGAANGLAPRSSPCTDTSLSELSGFIASEGGRVEADECMWGAGYGGGRWLYAGPQE